MCRRIFSVVIATLVALAVFDSATWAAPSAAEESRRHVKKARKAYDTGRWDEAIQEFQKAYDLQSDPGLIYDLAQSYRRKGDLKQALDLYRNFVREEPDGPLRATADDHIRQLEASLAALNPPPPPTPVEPTPPPPPPQQSVPVAHVPVVPARPAPTHSRVLPIAGIATAAVGAVGIGVGVVMTLKANSLANDIEKNAQAGSYNRSDENKRSTYATMSYVCYGVGGAALAGGVLMYVLGSRNTDSAVAFVPSADGGQLLVKGTF
jgi:tetratricopeptide (TPR) repeat protein